MADKFITDWPEAIKRATVLRKYACELIMRSLKPGKTQDKILVLDGPTERGKFASLQNNKHFQMFRSQ